MFPTFRFQAPSHGLVPPGRGGFFDASPGKSHIVTLFSGNASLGLLKVPQYICSLGPCWIGLGPLLWTWSGVMSESNLNETRIALLVGFELLPVNSCGETVKAAESECMRKSEVMMRWLYSAAFWEVRLLVIYSHRFGHLRLPSRDASTRHPANTQEGRQLPPARESPR